MGDPLVPLVQALAQSQVKVLRAAQVVRPVSEASLLESVKAVMATRALKLAMEFAPFPPSPSAAPPHCAASWISYLVVM